MDDEQKNNLPNKKVLIIEDDSFMGNLLLRKFKQESFDVSLACNAEEARKVISSNRPAIILLDIILPGIDGFGFLKELKGNPDTKEISVIITSNLGKPEEIEKGLAEGASDYIIKAQASTSEIVEKVRSLLEK